MAIGLSDDDRSQINSLAWTRPMWPFIAIVFVGGFLLLLGTVLEGSAVGQATPDGPSGAAIGDFVLAIVGGVIFISGLAARRASLNELALKDCPKCGHQNLWNSKFCRNCGAPGPAATAGGAPVGPVPRSPV